jgi:aromatic-L-amino-acid decarboxylase
MEPVVSLERLRAACARPLDHPDADERRRACQQVVDFVLDDFAKLGEGPVGRTTAPDALAALLCTPPPEQGAAFDRVMLEFCEKIAPHALRTNHPRFLAFVPGAASFPSLLGDWLCVGLDHFNGTWLAASGAAQVELVVLDWFRQILGYPAEASGILTGGGSEAILTALVAARERLPYNRRQHAVLYTSDQRHCSVDRGARIAGLRPDQIRVLPTAADLRLAPEVLRRAIEEDAGAGKTPWLVVANAGTTNTGAVDSLNEVADLCGEHGLWLHADAAYGWAAALTEEGRRLLHGIERADSISLDPHKWFAQTFDVGCLLMRRGAALAETFGLRPEYLQDAQAGDGAVNFGERGIALTRRFRALKIWFSVKVLGIDWFRRLVGHCLNLARFAEHLLRETAPFEVLARGELSVVCFRYAPGGWAGDALDELNHATCAAAIGTGRIFLATTRLQGVVALRMCFINWRSTAADVEETVRLLGDIGRRLAAEKGKLT